MAKANITDLRRKAAQVRGRAAEANSQGTGSFLSVLVALPLTGRETLGVTISISAHVTDTDSHLEILKRSLSQLISKVLLNYMYVCVRL